eukprot:7377513-Prymnesium_polylepis.1
MSTPEPLTRLTRFPCTLHAPTWPGGTQFVHAPPPPSKLRYYHAKQQGRTWHGTDARYSPLQ